MAAWPFSRAQPHQPFPNGGMFRVRFGSFNFAPLNLKFVRWSPITSRLDSTTNAPAGDHLFLEDQKLGFTSDRLVLGLKGADGHTIWRKCDDVLQAVVLNIYHLDKE